MRRVPFIDSTGLKNLKNFISRSRKQGIIVVMSGLQIKPREALEKEGIIEMLGNENVCPNIELALERAKQLMEKTHHPK